VAEPAHADEVADIVGGELDLLELPLEDLAQRLA
jgi:hypothetical protein